MEIALAPALIATGEALAIIANILDKLNKTKKVVDAARAAGILVNKLPEDESEETEKKPEDNTNDSGKKPEKPDGKIFKRPDGVPEDWIKKPTKKGDGVIYKHPKENGTYVKIQRGRPNSTNPGQRVDNVRWQKNGQSFDKNGNKVPKQSKESHIPVDKFRFDPEKLK